MFENEFPLPTPVEIQGVATFNSLFFRQPIMADAFAIEAAFEGKAYETKIYQLLTRCTAVELNGEKVQTWTDPADNSERNLAAEVIAKLYVAHAIQYKDLFCSNAGVTSLFEVHIEE